MGISTSDINDQILKPSSRNQATSKVEAQYPPRAAFAIPLIIEPANAYDVSVRATPEMVEYGKDPQNFDFAG
jgi:hypothetical protein